MRAIGGYFELADRDRTDNFPHKGGILLNTGRDALSIFCAQPGRLNASISH